MGLRHSGALADMALYRVAEARMLQPHVLSSHLTVDCVRIRDEMWFCGTDVINIRKFYHSLRELSQGIFRMGILEKSSLQGDMFEARVRRGGGRLITCQKPRPPEGPIIRSQSLHALHVHRICIEFGP